MKTEKWGKTILALVLAVVMIALVPLGVWAEDTNDSLGDLQWIHVEGNEEPPVGYYGDDKNGTRFEGEDTDGTIETGAIKNNEQSGFTPISIESHDATISVTTEAITDTRETNRNQEAAAITAVGDQSDVTFTSEEITSKSIGLEILNGDLETETTQADGGKVTATTGDIKADIDGVKIINYGDTTITTGAITAGEDGIGIWNYEGTVTAATGAITAEGKGVDIYAPQTPEEATTPNSTTVTVNGSLKVKGEENDPYTTGIYADGGSEINVTVNGPVTVEGTKQSTGVYARAFDDNAITIVTDGAMTVTASEGIAAGVTAVVTDEGGSISITQTGDMDVKGSEDATALYVKNAGNADILAKGNITSTDDGIVLDDESVKWVSVEAEGESDEQEKMPVVEEELIETWIDSTGTEHKNYHHFDGDKRILYDQDGKVLAVREKETGDPAATTVEVVGNVTAAETGIRIDLENDKSRMDVIVDGTVKGDTQSVLLSRDTVTDNLVLTVWEIKENKDGNLVERETYSEFDKDFNKTTHTEADKEMEKKIQYIIKVDPDQTNVISTNGTTKQGEYNVAKEGDTVTLKLNVPEGYKITKAFNGTDTKVELAQDAEGNYYLIVPRGGAVMLSVDMEKIPDPEPEPQPKPENGQKAQVATLLTIEDKSEEAKIIFYSDGTYKAVMKNNGTDNGTYALKGGQIVLTSRTGKTAPMTKNGSSWTLSFTGGKDAKTYEFEVADEKVQKLIEAMKK